MDNNDIVLSGIILGGVIGVGMDSSALVVFMILCYLIGRDYKQSEE